MSSVKSLLLGILVIILVGIGGLVYRNAVEHPNEPIACPVDAKVCPDGTSVAREGSTCVFPVCPPPNTVVERLGIAYAIPTGFEPFLAGGSGGQYEREYVSKSAGSTTAAAYITVRSYPIDASSTALQIIQKTAIGSPSDLPVPATSFSSVNIGDHHFTVVAIERFEGVIDTAYYFARESHGDVLRFDAIDHDVPEWTSATPDPSSLPAATALRQLLSTLEGQ